MKRQLEETNRGADESCDVEHIDEMDLLQLVHEARGGDPQAVAELIEAFREHLLNSARRAISPAVTGKIAPSDLVQESFLAAEHGFADFHGDTLRELRAWLRQIVVRRANEAHRRYSQTAKRQVHREIPLATGHSGNQVAAGAPTPGSRVLADEEARRVRDAVESLPPQYREVIRLHNKEGLPFEEVGKRMNRTTGAVKKLWLRALAKLRKQLDHVPPTPS